MDNISVIEKDFDLREIIDGEEYILNSPFGRHQRISQKLDYIVYSYVLRNKLGEVYYSPLDVIFADGINEVQPDLIFIRNENMSIFQDFIRGVPDMLCEIISKSTSKKDLVTKKALYEKYGVSEYWVVYPDIEMVEIFTIENSRYVTYSIAVGDGIVKSKVIDGLEFNITNIFT